MITVLEEEAEYAKDLWEHKLAEDYDWECLYELSVLLDQLKLQEDKAAMAASAAAPVVSDSDASTPAKLVRGTSGKPSKVASPAEADQGKPHFLDSVVAGYIGDGAFSTNEFINQYLKEDVESNSVIFDFCNRGFPTTTASVLTGEKERVLSLSNGQGVVDAESVPIPIGPRPVLTFLC